MDTESEAIETVTWTGLSSPTEEDLQRFQSQRQRKRYQNLLAQRRHRRNQRNQRNQQQSNTSGPATTAIETSATVTLPNTQIILPPQWIDSASRAFTPVPPWQVFDAAALSENSFENFGWGAPDQTNVAAEFHHTTDTFSVLDCRPTSLGGSTWTGSGGTVYSAVEMESGTFGMRQICQPVDSSPFQDEIESLALTQTPLAANLRETYTNQSLEYDTSVLPQSDIKEEDILPPGAANARGEGFESFDELDISSFTELLGVDSAIGYSEAPGERDGYGSSMAMLYDHAVYWDSSGPSQESSSQIGCPTEELYTAQPQSFDPDPKTFDLRVSVSNSATE